MTVRLLFFAGGMKIQSRFNDRFSACWILFTLYLFDQNGSTFAYELCCSSHIVLLVLFPKHRHRTTPSSICRESSIRVSRTTGVYFCLRQAEKIGKMYSSHIAHTAVLGSWVVIILGRVVREL